MSLLVSVVGSSYRDQVLNQVQFLSRHPSNEAVDGLRFFMRQAHAWNQGVTGETISSLVENALNGIAALQRFPLERWATPLYNAVALESQIVVNNEQDILQDNEQDRLQDTAQDNGQDSEEELVPIQIETKPSEESMTAVSVLTVSERSTSITGASTSALSNTTTVSTSSLSSTAAALTSVLSLENESPGDDSP